MGVTLKGQLASVGFPRLNNTVTAVFLAEKPLQGLEPFMAQKSLKTPNRNPGSLLHLSEEFFQSGDRCDLLCRLFL